MPQYVMASLSWNPKHWFWEYLVGNNNMRRRRMGEMQTKFHQKMYSTYACFHLFLIDGNQIFSICDARYLYFFAIISPKIQIDYRIHT